VGKSCHEAPFVPSGETSILASITPLSGVIFGVRLGSSTRSERNTIFIEMSAKDSGRMEPGSGTPILFYLKQTRR
jgi:hypothetical protein